jgi:hypothetical protein
MPIALEPFVKQLFQTYVLVQDRHSGLATPASPLSALFGRSWPLIALFCMQNQFVLSSFF